MRSIKRSLLVLVAAAALSVIAPNDSEAQSFPASTWVPLTRGLLIIGAASVAGSDKIVGDSTTGGAAAYVQSDATYLYIRLRVNADPTSGGTIRDDRLYGCEIDTDNDESYELLAIWDGFTNQVRLGQLGASSGSRADNTTAFLSSVAPTGPTVGRIVTPAGTSFGGNPDAFVDIAIPRTALDAGGAQAHKPLKFACGIGATNGLKALEAQLFDPNPVMLATAWSDPFVCSATGCAVDRDRDGVPDSVESALGTDPLDTDSDNDNIPDNTELSASGSTGPYTGPDTDGDGTIDALDTDSDNDCVDDINEGALNYRTRPANAHLQCGGTTPACSTATGDCAKCDGPNGGATPAKCPTSALPACFADGSCKQCGPGQTQNCIVAAAPACGSAGTCVACTGDNGAVTNAPCPSSAAPACHTSGFLFGQCTLCSRANGSRCNTAGAPACDTGSGTCSTCNGDFGGVESKPCSSAANPTCRLTAASGTVGTCGKCVTNADCQESNKHNGPTCNTTTGECIDTDTDGDGLNDSIELNLGLNTANADTDGDGIPDGVEARPNGGGAPAAIDTDGDGTIDAKDTDSDNDTILDAEEGTIDTDGDTAPNFRDPDDDGDGIPTSIEVVDGKLAKVSDDVDNDGKKNWLDKDADDNGVEDGDEGRGDEDVDGIPDYLDAVKDPPKVDSGASSSGGSSSGSTSVDGGFTSNELDAGAPVFDAGPIEEGVVEGTGLFCGRALGSTASDRSVFVLGALGVITVARRRRR